MKNRQHGQAMLMAIMCLGVIMATAVIFGHKRTEDMGKTIQRMDKGQIAYEALASAAKRVQQMYANESGCDPETLDTRLSALQPLPTSAASLGLSYGGGAVTYAIAQPSLSSPNKENRCTGGTGCRQFAVPVDNQVLIVTAGAVSRDPDLRTGDCPRDASVRLSVSIAKKVYFQRVTLTNLCTLAACDTSPPTNAGGRGFESISLTLSGTRNTLACTGAYSIIPIRTYGGGLTESTANLLTTQDLRFARRYLETGGGDVGDTNFLYATGALASGTNGACPPALSAGQCKSRYCFPTLDLNRDGVNNDSDLAIMENFMRGYINYLPAVDLP